MLLVSCNVNQTSSDIKGRMWSVHLLADNTSQFLLITDVMHVPVGI